MALRTSGSSSTVRITGLAIRALLRDWTPAAFAGDVERGKEVKSATVLCDTLTRRIFSPARRFPTTSRADGDERLPNPCGSTLAHGDCARRYGDHRHRRRNATDGERPVHHRVEAGDGSRAANDCQFLGEGVRPVPADP